MSRKITKYEFKPDPIGPAPLKGFYLTPRQRQRLLKWSLYAALVLAALVLQDTMLGRIRFCGATTDLAVCVIMLIGVMEGAETGGVFALCASILYYFSGSAPGPYVIAMITGIAIAAALFRQSYWSQGLSTAVLCTGTAMVSYELLLLVIGILMDLTRWNRPGVFLLTAILSAALVIPMYPVAQAIGKIGGDPWKE